MTPQGGACPAGKVCAFGTDGFGSDFCCLKDPGNLNAVTLAGSDDYGDDLSFTFTSGGTTKQLDATGRPLVGFQQGNAQDDRLYGSSSTSTDYDESLHGGDGDDLIYGYSGGDSLYGDAGADECDGGAGIDYVDGGIDNDTLIGGPQADELSASGGDDDLNGGTGADILYGDMGDDLVLRRRRRSVRPTIGGPVRRE